MYTYYILLTTKNHTAMSKVSVFENGWIDLVFEGRNQEYGAYQLRKQDSKTTMLALFSGIGIMVFLVSIPAIVNLFRPDLPVPDITADTTVIKIIEIEQPPLELPKPEPMIEEPAGAAAAQSAVPTTAFTPLAPTSEPVTTTVTTEILTNTQPSNITTEGSGTGPLINTPGTTIGTGTGPSVTDNGAGAIEHFVDVVPMYPGGLDRFRGDIADRFNAPDVGNLSVVKVLVSFVVEPDGTLSNIKATRDPGYGMGAEAVRVLKSLKAKWKPGMKSGKAVRTAYSLPIIVKVN
jgi:protein TonB